MANDAENDPGAAFRDMVTQWERRFDAFANQMMGTEAYASAMNQFQQSQLTAQKAFSDFMTQQLTSMNMPTREDVVRIGQAVRELDKRMERIEQLLKSGKSKKKRKRKGPPRTKMPPSADSSGQSG
ncbi:MAG: hypothetical protein O7H39_15745 [Gammaproteobacteria bacterium]|nr:hypothetical protein [Gammaproteobacteria bacterium]